MTKPYSRTKPLNKHTKALGKSLYKARQERGWTQKELRNQSGVAVQCIYEYERGLRFPTIKVLLRLAGALGVKVEEIGRALDEVGVPN